jgi:hypothetical protein
MQIERFNCKTSLHLIVQPEVNLPPLLNDLNANDSGIDGFSVSVDGKAAYQAPRLAQALKQLDDCLEVISAAAQGQVINFAGSHFSGWFVGYCPHRAFNHFIGQGLH